MPKDKFDNPIRTAYRDKGLRDTWQRRVVARVLAESPDHPDVNELHRRAFKIDSRLSLSTVYRNVNQFEQAGVLERHAFRNGRARFELNQGREHHDHLIDVSTGRVVEFHSEEIERLQSEIADRLGYRLVGHRLELYAEPKNELGETT